MGLPVLYLTLLSKALSLMEESAEHCESIYTKREPGSGVHEVTFVLKSEDSTKCGKYRVRDKTHLSENGILIEKIG